MRELVPMEGNKLRGHLTMTIGSLLPNPNADENSPFPRAPPSHQSPSYIYRRIVRLLVLFLKYLRASDGIF